MQSLHDKDVHASEDFLTLVVTTHFLVACMKKLKTTSLDDIPTTSEFNSNTWMKSNEDRRTTLYSSCQEMIVEHVNLSVCGDISCSSDGVRVELCK